MGFVYDGSGSMNLATSVILAGGPGSGCHGPTCGRPPKNIDELKEAQRNTMREDPYARPVIKDLLKIGGHVVDTISDDTFLEGYLHTYLHKFGKQFSAKSVKMVKGAAHDCHGNVCRLVKRDKSIQSVTGYALDKEGVWNRHSWGVTGKGKVVETTTKRLAYFGIPEDKTYSDWLDKQED